MYPKFGVQRSEPSRVDSQSVTKTWGEMALELNPEVLDARKDEAGHKTLPCLAPSALLVIAIRRVSCVSFQHGEVSLDVGEAREEELKNRDIFFKPALGKGAQMKRHDNTFDSACTIMRCIAFKAPLALRIQRELVDEEKDITETAAGAELGRELHEQAMTYKAEQRQLQDEMNEGIFPAVSYAEEKERFQRRMQDLDVTSRLEIERHATVNTRRIDEVIDTLRQTRKAELKEKMELAATLQRLQQQHVEVPRPRLFASIGSALDTIFHQ
ncbi:hypothetical protein BDN71DRAFT_1434740 [Pleurotus eryngii]|uniref:Uncharacterized protein n=1 Tax=Pleurotus eryngii TaxID=5323 RepID=A0A9P5ZR70_PLEER|nr:hypothetical protein BDN71DRAFT_1434740 [Pleurotus eryngii]